LSSGVWVTGGEAAKVANKSAAKAKVERGRNVKYQE
jgi:hypothetical protein